MHAIAKAVLVATILAGILNSFIFLGSVVALLKGYVGPLAYVLWMFAAPLLSPAAIGLPWFVAWVYGTEVNDRVFWIWASFFILMGLRALLWKWAPDK